MSRMRPVFPLFRLSPMGDIISDCEIGTLQLADCAVDSTKLADSAVSYQNIQSVTAARLLGRYDAVNGVVQEITLAGGLTFDSTTGTISSDTTISTVLSDSQVDSSALADSAVSTQGLQDCAVTSAKLGDTAVITAKINALAVTADKLFDTNTFRRIVEIHCTDTTLATGDTLATFFVPAEWDSYDLIRAEACVKVISTSGTPTIQVRDVTGAADMLSTKITIDSGEKTSYTAVTASVVDTGNDTLIAGQEISIDIDSAGTGTEDLYVILTVRKP